MVIFTIYLNLCWVHHAILQLLMNTLSHKIVHIVMSGKVHHAILQLLRIHYPIMQIVRSDTMSPHYLRIHYHTRICYSTYIITVKNEKYLLKRVKQAEFQKQNLAQKISTVCVKSKYNCWADKPEEYLANVA